MNQFLNAILIFSNIMIWHFFEIHYKKYLIAESSYWIKSFEHAKFQINVLSKMDLHNKSQKTLNKKTSPL